VAAALQFWPRPAAEPAIAAASAPAPVLASSAAPEPSADIGTGSSVGTAGAGLAPTVMAPVDAPASSMNPGQVAGAIEDINTLLPKLPSTITPAWRVLAGSWKLPETDADPCQAASAQQLQCYSSNDLTIPLLRQLGRPGILTLHGSDGPPVFAVLTGLNEQTATLRVGEVIHRVSLSSLGRLWRGAFATYWRPPPGFAAELRDGSSGAVIARLANQLSTLEGAPVPIDKLKGQTLDNALKARVRAFQKGQGLRPDGYPGPMTLMQIDRALGSSEPSLQAAAP
jgi:general secretion pathway protein A